MVQHTELRPEKEERTYFGEEERSNSSYFIVILFLMKNHQPINPFGNRSECGCAIFGFSVANISVFEIETDFVMNQHCGMNLDY